MTLAAQILVDGFVISALYGMGAIGFTLIFGVTGVLNLAHGAILVIAAMVGWFVTTHMGGHHWLGALAGISAAVVAAYWTYGMIVVPITRSRRIPSEEKEIFILTATLLWGIIIQGALDYAFSSNPVTSPPLVTGVTQVLGVRTPRNELLIGAIAWIVIGLLWAFVTRTRTGKALQAASMSPMGLALVGFDLNRVFLIVWGVYGILAGVAGVLLSSFLGASADQAGDLTGSAFSIVVLGGLGSVSGSLAAAYVIGYFETITAYLVSPAIRELPALLLVVLILVLRPHGIFGRR
ncbi:MAG: branched-chain amino acid ABC transporter permease [bacterium]|nr:branched-chain amino acid ABC transporter permease [bacterium]